MCAGNWHRDQKHGYGKYAWSDGDLYEGQWENDLRNAQGTCTYTNGDKYAGKSGVREVEQHIRQGRKREEQSTMISIPNIDRHKIRLVCCAATAVWEPKLCHHC